MNESLGIVESLLIQNTRNLLRLTNLVDEKEKEKEKDISVVYGCARISSRADDQDEDVEWLERFELLLESGDESRCSHCCGCLSDDAKKWSLAVKFHEKFRKARLVSLLDRRFDGHLSAAEAASAFCSSARKDANVLRSDVTDLYRDCLVEYVGENASASDVSRVVEMIKFCAQIEKLTRTRTRWTRAWNWSSTLLPLAPDVCRWVQDQKLGENCAKLVENLMDLAGACTNELESIARAVSAALDRHSTDLVRRSLRAIHENGKRKETLYALLDSVSCFAQIPCAARSECLQLASALVEQIVFLHKLTLANGILHDAESHDWQNDKPFFEGEKVSFAIQMWCLHMRALRSEMNARRPPYAQRIFVGVLFFSLSWFAQRYVRAQPSRARIPQFEADVAAILENANEFAVSVDDDDDDDEIAAAAAAIDQHRASLGSTVANGSGETQSRPDSTEAGLLSIRYRFTPHWPTVVELLVIEDGALAVAIIERATEDTTRAILDALVACHAFPHHLGSTVVQLVKKHDRWADLVQSARREPIPSWMRALDDLLERHCAPIIAPIFSKLFWPEHQSLKPSESDQLCSYARDQLLCRSASAFATLPRTMQLLFARLQQELPSSERSRLLVTESVYLHTVATKCCRLLPPSTFTDLLEIETKRSSKIMESLIKLERPSWDSDQHHQHDDDLDYTVAATQMMSDGRDALTALHRHLLERKLQTRN